MFFSSERYQHLAKIIDEWAISDPKLLEYFGGRSLLSQSHGESFMSYFTSRFAIEGIYFLDEPETALSPRRQIEFVKTLVEHTRDGHAQFIIATHSPILLSCPVQRSTALTRSLSRRWSTRTRSITGYTGTFSTTGISTWTGPDRGKRGQTQHSRCH